MSLSLILILIGILGFVLNRKNIILMLISLEIMLLSITFLILLSSLSFDDILGQTYAIYIITIAGAESAIGLGILVAFYRLRGTIAIDYKIMYLALIVLPLLASLISGFFGRKVGASGAQLITCSCVIATTVLSLVAFFEVGLNNIPVSIELFRWIDSESLLVHWGFQFDSLTVSMLIPVLIISSLVHVYSIGYMSINPHKQRFFSYLSLFTFMMIILVTSNNFLLMFAGWEGVGICSYLLVSFWFTRIAANQSSMSAFLTNRVGDCFLTIGMFALLWSFGNIDYSTVFSLATFFLAGAVMFILIMATSFLGYVFWSLSVITTYILLDVLYRQLTKGIESSRYLWLTFKFYTDMLRVLLKRAYESIEWVFSSPPKPHSFVSLPVESFSISPVFKKIFGHIKHNWVIITSVVFIIITMRTIPVIMCKDVFGAYDLADIIVVIYGFTHAIVCLFKRCYKTDYRYKNNDFIFDLAFGLIIAKLVILFSVYFGLIALMCLTSIFPSNLPYFILLLEQFSLTQIKAYFCVRELYTHTPYTPDIPGATHRIYPTISEALWRSYAGGKMPCLWHMVTVDSITDTPTIIEPGSTMIEAMVTWDIYKETWRASSKSMREEIQLYTWLINSVPAEGEWSSVIVEDVVNNTANAAISTMHKNNLLVVLRSLNNENRFHTTLNYESRPFKECLSTDTTLGDLRIYSRVKRECLKVKHDEHLALYKRAWDEANRTGYNIDGPFIS